MGIRSGQWNDGRFQDFVFRFDSQRGEPDAVPFLGSPAFRQHPFGLRIFAASERQRPNQLQKIFHLRGDGVSWSDDFEEPSLFPMRHDRGQHPVAIWWALIGGWCFRCRAVWKWIANEADVSRLIFGARFRRRAVG